MDNRNLTALSIIAVFTIGLGMAIAAGPIHEAVSTVATPTAIALAILVCLVVGGTGTALFLRLYHVAGIAGAQKRRANAQASLVEARARRERRAASAVVIVDANKQVFKPTFDADDNMTDIRRVDLPGLPGVNGAPVELTPFQERMLFKWHVLHNTASVSPGNWEVVEPAGLSAGRTLDLPPILPRLLDAQRLIIAGGSDAGKTTLVKHIVAGRIDHSRIIPIDPHAPSKILGFDVIGAGRDYAAIADALESLVLLMTSRYQDVKAGVLGYGQHERVSVFIDEWTGIVRNVDRAGDQLAILLTESRKVNIHLTLCCHSTTIEALGLPDAQIRKSATVVEIVGGNGAPRRAFIQPAGKTNPDGSKAKPQEYALPGPFAGYVQAPAEVVRALPDSKILKAQMMEAADESITAIAAEYFGVDKPNGRQLKQIRELLERATIARQGYDNNTTGS
ncbi:MAG: hypothetical protein H6631_20635 [Anaerolineaceae bacterium]|nr:hypothetical protein [Anaerolineaceae bacterium]MCB9109552.1 hypothetical protein [Anaerolineales bacterium]